MRTNKPRKQELLKSIDNDLENKIEEKQVEELKEVKKVKQKVKSEKKCGLCGKRRKLIKTECCNEWICDDESKYVMFSYARNSCHRNHDRYTLCSHHLIEGHTGEWKTCKKCRKEFDTEMYVWYGTNEYNFSKLENPPKYKPTKCNSCDKIIKLSEGGYSLTSNGYYCFDCSRF